MPYQPQNKKDLKSSDLKLKADRIIAADAYNLTPDFFEKYKSVFERIGNSVDEIVKSYGFSNKNNSDIINPLKNYNRLLYNTIDKKNTQQGILDIKSSNLDSGIRSISQEDTSNTLEDGIINSFQKITQESFALMEEYRTSCELIPELKRVMKLIVRDIINANEITKRSIHDVYSKPNDDISETTDDVDAINKIIDSEITDKYKIEEKLEIWLYEALITGAKPLLVIPYRDIVKQALALSASQNKDGSYSFKGDKPSTSARNMAMSVEDLDNMSFEDFEEFSYEAIDPFKLDRDIRTDKILRDRGIKKVKYNYKSAEDLNSNTKAYEDFINDIIDDSLIENVYSSGLEELYETYKIEKKKADEDNEFRLSHGLEADSSSYNTANSIKEFIDKLNNKDESEKTDEEKEKEEALREKYDEMHIKESIKKQLGEFVCKIDKNINIVNDDYAALNLGKTNLMRRMNKSKIEKNMIDGMYVEDKDTIDSISQDFDKEVLVTELNPEYVIPVSIGSQHIQYYIYEAEAYEGPSESPSRRSTSFANIIASTGYGNDKAVISASNGVSIVPNDPAMSSVFNPANLGNINIPINGTDLTENNARIDIIKQIVYRTLAKRMCDPSLSENKSFTDAIMNLIRQGYILNREIKFTCVPATNIVYLAHDIDDKGLPHSILDGTLLQIYMYLAGIVSMTMNIVNKSSDKEKLELNMGMSHQLGMSLMEIQKQLSTRNIHVKSFFNNIGSVLRNVATYARYSIPVVEGEKLYDISTVERAGDSPIDTDFIEKRLSSVLSSIPAPPAILNMMQEAEFSRSILNQNYEYRNSINEKAFTFGKQLTKLYRLIALYSRLSKPLSNEEKELQSEVTTVEDEDKKRLIKIKNMNVRFVSPTYLNMTNIADTFSNIEPVIDSFSKYLFGEDQDTPLDKFMVQRFKKECIKVFAGNIDLSYMESIADNIKNNPFEGVSDEIKMKIIGKKTEGLFSGDDIEGDSSSDSGGSSDFGGGDDFGGGGDEEEGEGDLGF